MIIILKVIEEDEKIRIYTKKLSQYHGMKEVEKGQIYYEPYRL